MATYGAGMRIDSKVNVQITATGTIYTVPANKYLIANWQINTTDVNGKGTILLDAVPFVVYKSGSASAAYLSSAAASNIDAATTFYPSVGGVMHLGPGTVIGGIITATAAITISGVLLSN